MAEQRSLEIDLEAAAGELGTGEDEVRAMLEVVLTGDEDAAAVSGIVRRVKVDGLDAALRDHDWLAFAAGYFGDRSAGVDARLAFAHAKWLRIKNDPRAPIDLAAAAAEESGVAEVAPLWVGVVPKFAMLRASPDLDSPEVLSFRARAGKEVRLAVLEERVVGTRKWLRVSASQGRSGWIEAHQAIRSDLPLNSLIT